MQITEEQAKIIATALMKPIKDGYAESQFGVYNGDQGVVGIVRKFKKCYVFVEFNGRRDNSVRLPKMTTPLQLDVVIDRVIEALDIAATLQGKDLDTEKPNFHPYKVGSFIKKRPDYKEPEKKNNLEKMIEEELDVKEPVKDTPKEAAPTVHEDTKNDSEKKDPVYVPPKAVDVEPEPEPELEEIPDELEKAPSEAEEVTSEPEAETPQPKETMVQTIEDLNEYYKEDDKEMPNEVELTTLENEKGEPNAFYALTEVNGSPEQSLAEIDLKKESALCRQIAKHQDVSSEEMQKVFATLIENAPRAAEMLYMATMVTALKVNGGDAEEIAEKLGIDEKDLIMANYEYELRKTRE
ncbi:MAG: hypothetical protein J6I68_14485 [Butyrivibrio sp.]|uniref:hypothetical protein n=1 Tax=Butyrivibrio sp. TaxID=28121 RepID=UPI001B670091|nr:hypothetical protein [Butyrivibrio sp.]MBP3784449.1 hypothetical protein [Butyrivibrio sp.]